MSRFILLVLLVSQGACATMAHGRTQVVPVMSNPPGARVLVDGDSVGITPMNVTLRRKQEHRVSLSMDGLAPVDVAIRRQLSGWMVGSFFLYYVPVAVDLVNGAAWNLTPDTVSVDFPDAPGVDVAASMGLSRNRRIRVATPNSQGLFMNGSVDSVAGGRLFWRYAGANVHSDIAPASLPINDLPRLHLYRQPNRRAGGVMGMRVASMAAFGIPMIALALEGAAEWGPFLGALYSVYAIPAGFLAGAVAAPDQWAPLEAYRAGSPLLVNDRLRLRVHGSGPGLSGRLADMDPTNLVMVVRGDTVRVLRSTVQSMQRSDGFSLRKGIRNGALAGAVFGFTALSMCNCRSTQQDVLFVSLAGASLGLFAAPALAPRRWVDVLKW